MRTDNGGRDLRLNRAGGLLLLVTFLVAAAVSLAAEARRAEARPAKAVPAQTGRLSECGGLITRTLSTDEIRLCDTVDVQVVVEPSCPVCLGGLNVVYVQIDTANQAEWMNASAVASLQELERLRTIPIKVGVVHYNSFGARAVLPMTEMVSRARGKLNEPTFGHDPTGKFEEAARLALEMLRTERGDAERRGLVPCEMIIYFATTKDVFLAEGRSLLRAAGMIHRENIPLLVGCPELTERYCTFTIDIAKSRRLYTEPPARNELMRMVRDQIDDYSVDAELRTADLRQIIPTGLRYLEASGVPAPALKTTDDGLVELAWTWSRIEANMTHTVTYQVAPMVPGAAAIRGEMELTDFEGRSRTLPMPEAVITTTGPCVTVTPTPLDTTTDTPEPTRVPTSTYTPTPTHTPTHGPIYLPIAISETCRGYEKLSDVALVIDMSTSMQRNTEDGIPKSDAVIAAARAFVSALDFEPGTGGAHDQVAIVWFNGDADIALELTNDVEAIDAAIGGLPALQAQGTRLDLAFDVGMLALAPERLKEGNTPVMVMLTDGLPNNAPLHPESGRQEETVLEAASRAKDAGVTVFTIGFGRAEGGDLLDRVNAELLRECASDPGKSYVEPRADRLVGIYESSAEVYDCPKGRHDWGKPWP